MNNEYPNAKVNAVIYRTPITADFDREDWRALALAALDQAGFTDFSPAVREIESADLGGVGR